MGSVCVILLGAIFINNQILYSKTLSIYDILPDLKIDSISYLSVAEVEKMLLHYDVILEKETIVQAIENMDLQRVNSNYLGIECRYIININARDTGFFTISLLPEESIIIIDTLDKGDQRINYKSSNSELFNIVHNLIIDLKW